MSHEDQKKGILVLSVVLSAAVLSVHAEAATKPPVLPQLSTPQPPRLS